MNDDIITTIDGVKIAVTDKLLKKYDKPLPRYTSYPPAPLWTKAKLTDPRDEYINALKSAPIKSASLYIHLPFCRVRCTFCACNAIVTSKRDIVAKYLKAIISEMDLILKEKGEKPSLSSLHWGGGTPTFLGNDEIKTLQDEIFGRVLLEPDAEVGIEADPRCTDEKKLETIRESGFNRLSLGIQDTNPDVQKACGRVEDLKHIERLIEKARQLAFSSINADICYGLPRQNPDGFSKTIEDMIALSPDRIALFNFAYVPWMHPHQRAIDKKDLPSPRQKIEMFLNAIHLLGRAGYAFIGLDHFAKKEDELSRAKNNLTLKRTFQGYTAKNSATLIGLGVTSIGEFQSLYVQNERKLAPYLRAVEARLLPISRGFKLSKDDIIRKGVMQDLFCRQFIDKKGFRANWHVDFDEYFADLKLIDEMIKDNLVTSSQDKIQVAPLGRIFIRNIASQFDAYLKPEEQKYSRAV